MYRILTPNGQWIIEGHNGLILGSLEAAVKFAQRRAQQLNDHGEYLVYDGDADTPCAATRMEQLAEDNDAPRR